MCMQVSLCYSFATLFHLLLYLPLLLLLIIIQGIITTLTTAKLHLSEILFTALPPPLYLHHYYYDFHFIQAFISNAIFYDYSNDCHNCSSVSLNIITLQLNTSSSYSMFRHHIEMHHTHLSSHKCGLHT